MLAVGRDEPQLPIIQIIILELIQPQILIIIKNHKLIGAPHRLMINQITQGLDGTIQHILRQIGLQRQLNLLNMPLIIINELLKPNIPLRAFKLIGQQTKYPQSGFRLLDCLLDLLVVVAGGWLGEQAVVGEGVG